MKNTVVFFSLFLAAFALSAQDKGVQVSPSDQVVYPDASQVINKTAGTKALPPEPMTTKPVVAATPIKAGAVAAAKTAAHGWFLRWVISGDEASARAWAAPLAGASMTALPSGSWEVLWGPVAADSLSKALNQSAQAQLVYR